MDHSLSLTIAIWIWVVLAAIAVIGAGTLSVWALIEEEWYPAALALVCFVASFGFLYLSLAILGQPNIATWSWRILAGVAVCFGVIACIRAMIEFADAGEMLSLLGTTAGSIVVFVLSILAVWRWPTGGAPAASVSRAAEAVSSQMSIWHNIALLMLLLATFWFTSLFVISVRRGIPTSIESHWGGLGGGLGGWQISPTLSSLIGAIVFGVLFSLFLLREESAFQTRIASSVAKEAGAPISEEKPKSTANNNTNAAPALTKPVEGLPAMNAGKP